MSEIKLESTGKITAQEAAELERQKRLIRNMMGDLEPIKSYLDAPAVTDIAIQDSGEIIISRFGEGRIFTGKQVAELVTLRIIKSVAACVGVKVEAYSSLPKLEAFIPHYNARITGLLPPKVIRPSVSIRKPSTRIYTLEDYVANGQMTQEQKDVIEDAIRTEKNIVVAGSTGSGKTTLTNAIIKKMQEFTPKSNFYIVEDVPELQCSARMKQSIYSDKHTAWEAVEEALRFNPDRIIFGEVRNALVMVALATAWNTGHKGSVTTIHANSCLATLSRIKKLLISGGDRSTADELSEIIHLVIHLTKTDDGIRVDEIMEVSSDTDNLLSVMEANGLD